MKLLITTQSLSPNKAVKNDLITNKAVKNDLITKHLEYALDAVTDKQDEGVYHYEGSVYDLEEALLEAGRESIDGCSDVIYTANAQEIVHDEHGDALEAVKYYIEQGLLCTESIPKISIHTLAYLTLEERFSNDMSELICNDVEELEEA